MSAGPQPVRKEPHPIPRSTWKEVLQWFSYFQIRTRRLSE